MKKFFCILLCLATSGWAVADVSNYTFYQSNGTYSEITGGIVLGTENNDDQRFVDPLNPQGGTTLQGPGFDIGFGFYFNGVLFDRIGINTNGWIAFGSSQLSPAVDLSSTSSYMPLASVLATAHPVQRNRIAALGRDLQGQSGASLRIQTIGTAPYRICVIQWKNYKRYASAGTGDTLNFQIRLHENGGLESDQYIEIVYGKVVFGSSSTFSAVAQVGLGGLSAADFNSRRTDFPHNWNNTTQALTSSDGCQLPFTTLSVVPPANGLTFTFEPPAACSGYPYPGATLASSTNVCPGQSVTLSLQNFLGTNVTYNWAYSLDGINYFYLYVPSQSQISYTITQDIWFLCEVICNTSGMIAYSDPVQVTAFSSLTLPYTESFESITANNELPSCMQATNLGVMTLTYTADQGSYNRYPYTGNKFASFRYGCNDYFFTNGVVLEAGKTYEFFLYYITDGYNGWNTLAIYYGNAPMASAMTTLVASVSNPNNTTYQQLKGQITPMVTGTYFIGIYCHASFVPWYLSFDELTLYELLPCSGQPNAGSTIASASTICPGNSVTLSLSGSTVASGIAYQWQSSPDGNVWTNIANANTNIYSLVPSASAYYRCQITCTLSGQAAFSTPMFVQVVSNMTLPYTEGFESITQNNQYPNCMTSTNLGIFTLTYVGDQGSYNRYPYSGNKFAAFRYGCNDWFFTTAIPVTMGNTYLLSLYYITDGYPGWEKLSLHYGAAPSSTSMLGTVAEVLTPNNTTYQNLSGTFTAPFTGQLYVGVYCSSSYVPWYLSFDELLVAEYPPCSGTPNAGTAVSSGISACSGVPFKLSLTGSSLASGLAYQWESSPDGINWSAMPGATTQVYMAAQTTPTYYRCKVTCTNSGLSAYSTVVYVDQLGAPSLPYIESFETITVDNELPNCMSATDLGKANLTYTSFQTTHNRVPHTGSKFASFAAPCDDYFFTSGLSLTGGIPYQFIVYYVTDGFPGWSHLSCYYGDAPTPAGMTNLLISQSQPKVLPYTPLQKVFVPATSGIYYFGIHCASSTSAPPFYLTFDDLTIKQFSCDAPSTLNVTNITANSATVSWLCNECFFPFYAEVGKAPTYFGAPGNMIFNPAASPLQLSGLQSNTTYTVFVQQQCTPYGQSVEVQFDFTTLLATGLKEEAVPVTLSVYPNPSDGLFQVELQSDKPSIENVSIEVRNMIGQSIYARQYSQLAGSWKGTIDLSAEKGLYLLQIRIGSASYVSRLIVH
ncbi:MAG: T9SS type A sorting domain-containing protein [Chitinophagales bacterium]|nr:T9SS type A sorting domain-containing protein [Chitinophagales bacterium]MDW8427784.1 T9SS type A sorting domain-containing protein [Chitinophagales bacterium]